MWKRELLLERDASRTRTAREELVPASELQRAGWFPGQGPLQLGTSSEASAASHPGNHGPLRPMVNLLCPPLERGQRRPEDSTSVHGVVYWVSEVHY